MATTTKTSKGRRGDLRRALADATPLYAAAGAGDLAVEKLRTVPAALAELAARVEPTRLAGELQSSLQARLQTRGVDLQHRVVALPQTIEHEARDLSARATTAAVDVTGRAGDVYEDLAARGKNLVVRVRRQRATEEVKEQAATTVRRTRSTARTARSSATATKRSASGAATSARRTAAAATKAAEDAASKIG